jgi:uncharacterized membrane protein YeaQ/YmgE (transglycosylase-associated protein family)
MTLFYWIIFGLIAGSIANLIDPTAQGGILGSIILGIVGAIVGGYLGEKLFGVGITGFDIRSFIVAVIGSLIVLFVGRMLLHG